jgi:hypothetical protein
MMMMMAQQGEQNLHQDDQQELLSLWQISCFYSQVDDQYDAWPRTMMMQLQQAKIWDYSYFRVDDRDCASLLYPHHLSW